MIRPLRITIAALLACAAFAACAHAGLNAGGVAALYWQEGTAAGLAARNSTSITPQLLVTVKGMNNFRGADVQLSVERAGCGYGPGAPAWDFSPDGCNSGNMTSWRGGRGGVYPNLFTASPALTGVATSQEGMLVRVNDCVNPNGIFLLWLSSAGAAGVVRTPPTEYGIWALKFDFTANLGNCAGDPADAAGPAATCITANFRMPCTDLQRGTVLGVVDGNLAYDYLSFQAGKAWLSWNLDWRNYACPNMCDPTHARSWGELRKLYR